jgi:hypothetical protein
VGLNADENQENLIDGIMAETPKYQQQWAISSCFIK